MTSSTRLEQIIRVYSHQDIMGIVLRVHVYLEESLDRILRTLLPVAPRQRDLNELRLAPKVRWTYALGGVDARMRTQLLAINGLRNKLAHEPDSDATRTAERRVIGTLSARQAALLETGRVQRWQEDSRRKELPWHHSDLRVAIALIQNDLELRCLALDTIATEKAAWVRAMESAKAPASASESSLGWLAYHYTFSTNSGSADGIEAATKMLEEDFAVHLVSGDRQVCMFEFSSRTELTPTELRGLETKLRGLGVQCDEVRFLYPLLDEPADSW